MERASQPKKRKVIITGFGLFLLFILGFSLFAYFNFHTIEVSGESMEPTFEPGKRVMVSKAYWLVGDIKKNDIVVIKRLSDGEILIKRVYAMGGEKVDFYNVPENWSLTQGEYRVPDGEYYLLGDNRPVSEDSRHFGSVTPQEIVGKVIAVRMGLPSNATANAKE